MMTASEFNASAPAATFLVRGAVVPAADTIILTIGLTANSGTILAANTNDGNISFSAFGSEIS